ncbi:hypothetical protein Val02_82290 [Virgisporangium aliadipatigenens]|uniref:Uncharacterized protein n=1 Tax=Virgisporangium aliadipatigenens TaxID=741659 RepID=A0A8J4DVM7_9ACTN|nr:hypothetical protein [Virgisporangium aliadipatigenens]GIJ51343.1 hypothetical protein Val02_82290 [Virgisporangium aliadipatigenens]
MTGPDVPPLVTEGDWDAVEQVQAYHLRRRRERVKPEYRRRRLRDPATTARLFRAGGRWRVAVGKTYSSSLDHLAANAGEGQVQLAALARLTRAGYSPAWDAWTSDGDGWSVALT